MRLGEAFYRKKVREVQDALERRGLDGLLCLHYAEIYYLVGFFHYPTERPVGLFIAQAQDPILFIPRLEQDYVHEGAWAPDVETYFEYPGLVHPLDWIGQRLRERGLASARLGWAESLSAGTRSRLATALPHVEWHEAGDIVAGLRLAKEPEEVALMRRAGAYA